MDPYAPSESETPRSPVAARPVDPATPAGATAPAEADAHTDPISGEAGAHPVGVGLGAASAGTAGAVIGAILGPVGAVIGAAIGAVAGGLAGKELASTETTATDEYSLSKPDGDVLTEPGVNVRPGSFAADQEQIAVAPLDRLSKDIGYKDAQEGVLRSDTALPRDVVPAPYQPAEPGDGEYATAQRGGPIPESAIMQPPVPTVGEAPSSVSDLPLAPEQAEPLKEHGDTLAASVDTVTEHSPYTLSDSPSSLGSGAPAKFHGDTLASATDSETTIRERAYYNYLARTESGAFGDESGDWLKAEHEVLHK